MENQIKIQWTFVVKNTLLARNLTINRCLMKSYCWLKPNSSCAYGACAIYVFVLMKGNTATDFPPERPIFWYYPYREIVICVPGVLLNTFHYISSVTPRKEYCDVLFQVTLSLDSVKRKSNCQCKSKVLFNVR